MQGHRVCVVGVGEQWGRELPGLVGGGGREGEGGKAVEKEKEKMKIAWRYERLGEFGAGAGATGSRGGDASTSAVPFGVYKDESFVRAIGTSTLS